MKNLWNIAEAAEFPSDLGARVYSSRLLGRDPSLVLHGGGNTSVKVMEKNVFHEPISVLYVKGTGGDLATIDASGFSPCRMDHLLKLTELESLSDLRMAAELRASMTNQAAPAPSVEAMLHAIIPAKYVDHTHADAVLTISNTVGGEDRIRDIYDDRVIIIPYVMPGFRLAHLCARLLEKRGLGDAIGIVLLNHGLISFGETAEESYGRTIELATMAEEYLDSKRALWIEWPRVELPPILTRVELADFRRGLSLAVGSPVVMATHRDAQTLGFIWRTDAAEISSLGPATPDHVIRTKRLPMMGRDLNAYRSSYEAYFNAGAATVFPRPTMLAPAPRVILDPAWGMLTAGRTAREAAIASDIYRHTIDMIVRATALGGWKALPALDIFACEYWDFELAKMKRMGPLPPFSGEVALVTGAASGIGRACVEALLQRGAAVVGLDIDPTIVDLHDRPDYHGIVCDLSIEADMVAALDEAVRTFGGVDILILNAGIFPDSEKLGNMSSDTWHRVMSVNMDSAFVMMRECHPLLRLSMKGGRVVVIGSKNVPAPGPGAAAYSASKAAVNQLARVAALEWGEDRIRINSLHPNMVFDTALWTQEILEARARNYGMTVANYKTNNVLKVEILSKDVAALAAELCGPLFAKTTGAQIPVDGGNERVI